MYVINCVNFCRHGSMLPYMQLIQKCKKMGHKDLQRKSTTSMSDMLSLFSHTTYSFKALYITDEKHAVTQTFFPSSFYVRTLQFRMSTVK